MPAVTVLKTSKFSSKYYASGVEVQGLTALNAKLRTMPTRISNKLQRTAARKAAHRVAEKARELCPAVTGKLRASIKVKALKRSRKNRGRVGARVLTGKGLFRGDTYYGGFVEFGTSRGTRQPAQAFMRAAAQYTEDEVAGIFRAALGRAIKDEEVKRETAAMLHGFDPVMFAAPKW